MKKLISLVVLTLILILSITTVNASSEVKVMVNGQAVTFDAKPYIDSNNRTLVPVRFISEKLGATVEWKADTRQVIILKENNEITLTIGSSKVDVNGKSITLDTVASIKDDRTFVPVRFVSEVLGGKVEWDGSTRTVLITTPKAEFVLNGKTYVSENPHEDVIRVTREVHEILSKGEGLLYEQDNLLGNILQWYYTDENVDINDFDQRYTMDINFSTCFKPHSQVPEDMIYIYEFMFEKANNTDDVLDLTREILISIFQNEADAQKAYDLFVSKFKEEISNPNSHYIAKEYKIGNRTILVDVASGIERTRFIISRKGM